MSTVIDPISRLSLKIENTTSTKPKRCLYANNPGISTCSSGGATSLKRLSLYRLDTTNELGVIKYSHRLFVTNSMVFTDELYRKVPTTATSRVFGMCFSGSRKCHKMFTDVIMSSKQVSRKAPLSNVEAWWRCKDCQNLEKYNEWDHDFPAEKINIGSCIEEVFKRDSPTELVSSMCRGCRAAIMCRHILEGLTNRLIRRPLSKHLRLRLAKVLEVQDAVRKLL